MLRKLMKYDFRAVLKLWSIGAGAVLLLGVLEGFCSQAELSGRNFNVLVSLVLSVAQNFSYMATFAFYIMNILILSLRFYKNCFTDEGYLTFTLPVQRHTILNSKLIVSLVMMVATFWICVLNGYIADKIATVHVEELEEAGKYVYYSDSFGSMFLEIIKEFFVGAKENGKLLWFFLFSAEITLIILLSTIFSILFMSNCITIGSIVAKRGKVIAGIGIYCGANFVFTIITLTTILYGLPGILTYASEDYSQGYYAMLLLLWVASQGLLCSLLYVLQYRLLDRKLNLP